MLDDKKRSWAPSVLLGLDHLVTATDGVSVGSRAGNCICQQCKCSPAVYKCPACFFASCSLPCVQAHKKTRVCTGKRLAYDPANRISAMDSTTLSRDVQLLDKVASVVEGAARGTARELSSRLTGDDSSRGRGLLRQKCRERHINLRLCPAPLRRNFVSTTRVSRKSKGISWHIEWFFPIWRDNYLPDEACLNCLTGPGMTCVKDSEMCEKTAEGDRVLQQQAKSSKPKVTETEAIKQSNVTYSVPPLKGVMKMRKYSTRDYKIYTDKAVYERTTVRSLVARFVGTELVNGVPSPGQETFVVPLAAAAKSHKKVKSSSNLELSVKESAVENHGDSSLKDTPPDPIAVTVPGPTEEANVSAQVGRPEADETLFFQHWMILLRDFECSEGPGTWHIINPDLSLLDSLAGKTIFEFPVFHVVPQPLVGQTPYLRVIEPLIREVSSSTLEKNPGDKKTKGTVLHISASGPGTRDVLIPPPPPLQNTPKPPLPSGPPSPS